MENLGMHFEKLEKCSQESIIGCNEALHKYFRTFETLLNEEI